MASQGRIVCPHCKTETQVPSDGGLESLKKSTFVEEVVQIYVKMHNLCESEEDLVLPTRVPKPISHEQNEKEDEEYIFGVPFQLSVDQAKLKFKEWVQNLKTAPHDFEQNAKIESLISCFCPCYEFKTIANTTYEAILQTPMGLQAIQGDHGGHYLARIFGSETLEPTLSMALQQIQLDSFQDQDLTKEIKENNVKVLSLDLPERNASGRADLQAQELEKKATAEFIMTRYQRLHPYGFERFVTTTTCNHRFSCKRFIPIFCGTYSFKDKRFSFVVHGAKGNVVGSSPKSIVKSLEHVMKMVLLLLGLLVMMYFFATQRTTVIYYM